MESIWQLKTSAMMLSHTQNLQPKHLLRMNGGWSSTEAPLPGSFEIFAGRGTRWRFVADNLIVPVSRGRWGKVLLLSQQLRAEIAHLR